MISSNLYASWPICARTFFFFFVELLHVYGKMAASVQFFMKIASELSSIAAHSNGSVSARYNLPFTLIPPDIFAERWPFCACTIIVHYHSVFHTGWTPPPFGFSIEGGEKIVLKKTESVINCFCGRNINFLNWTRHWVCCYASTGRALFNSMTKEISVAVQYKITTRY